MTHAQREALQLLDSTGYFTALFERTELRLFKRFKAEPAERSATGYQVDALRELHVELQANVNEAIRDGKPDTE